MADNTLKLRSQARVMALLSEGLEDLGLPGDDHRQPYGLGTSRSLRSLWEMCGIDFEQRLISERAKWGGLERRSFVE